MNIFAAESYSPIEYPELGKGRFDPFVEAEERQIILAHSVEGHPLGAEGIGAPISSHKALVEPSGELITFVSDKYSLLQNEDVNSAVLDLINEDPELVLHSRENKGYQTTWSLALENPLGTIKVGSINREYTFLVRITNSLDTTKAFSVDAGIVVYYCKNQFSRPANGTLAYRKHTNVVNLGETMNNVYAHKKNTLNAITSSLSDVATWSENDINKAFRKVNSVFPSTDPEKVNTHAEKILEVFRRDAGTYGHGGVALWMAATEVTTYWREYDIPASYVDPLRKKVWEVFS